jgi:hypothetical protein
MMMRLKRRAACGKCHVQQTSVPLNERDEVETHGIGWSVISKFRILEMVEVEKQGYSFSSFSAWYAIK